MIAAGGKKATENGKIAALGTGLPLVVFAFDPGYIGYGDRVFETTERDGSVTARTVNGKIKIVFDPSVSCDPDRVAAGYGAICTSLVYLFEKEVRSVLSREKYDRKVAAEVLKVVAAAIKAETVSSPSEAVIRGIAALTGIFAGERFMGGESVARVAELLKKRKSREENAAFLCRETLCVYRLVMRLITPAVRVPDVNARLDFMAKRFGISPVVLTKNLGRYVPAGELARKIYCVREFAPDLDVKAAAYLGILDFAFKRFKRLYNDRGFSYNGYVRAEEKKLCFALAPDVGSAFTLLDLARETGLTDALIQRKTDERIAQKTKCFLLDLDGTIYDDDDVIDGAIDAVNRMRKRGKVVFLTNNSSLSAEDYLARLTRLGFAPTTDEVVTAGTATIEYVRARYGDSARVFALCTDSFRKEAIKSGLNLVDSDPDVAIVCYDTDVTFKKFEKTCDFVFAGVPYVASHPDVACPKKGGMKPT
ncbi:MAG: HAD-IIA family hydrolase [Christensenellales bacterium]